MNTSIEFTRVNNDVNGNPRYVCHFLEVPLTENDLILINSSRKRGENAINRHYELALRQAKKIGGKKYTGKDFGGGIVFQSYNIKETEKNILELVNR